jgi:hypothetical protein
MPAACAAGIHITMRSQRENLGSARNAAVADG